MLRGGRGWNVAYWLVTLAATAAAKVAVLLGLIVLLTGMVWGRSAWGVWWTWSPRLTFTLMLWLLYVVYVVVRPAVESPERRAVISAVYGVVAFLDVPLVYFTARLLPDVHPASVALAGSMKLTLVVWFIPVTLIAVGLIVGRYRLAAREASAESLGRGSREGGPIPEAGAGGATR